MHKLELEMLNDYQLRQVADGCFLGPTRDDVANAKEILKRRHGDCCSHPRWRHKLQALTPGWRAAAITWLITKGAVVFWLLHPVWHTILRLFGIDCF